MPYRFVLALMFVAATALAQGRRRNAPPAAPPHDPQDPSGIWREIWTDGRKFPEDPDLAWYGYSVGKWEGDQFVIDTAGLDPRAWADEEGLPKSESARVQERYHRLDRDNLELTVIITDPKLFTKPVTGKFMFRLQPN